VRLACGENRLIDSENQFRIQQKRVRSLAALFLLIILLVFMLPGLSWAALEDDMVDLADKNKAFKTAVKESKGKWMPVPIPVVNPTVGNGLQAVLLYLHPKTSIGPTTLNATSGIMGMYTDTRSWFVGGFHDTAWEEDLYRFRILAGSGEFNLDYYGIGGGSIFADNPVPYNITSDILLTQLLRRIPKTQDWYLGMRYMYSNANISFAFNRFGLPPISANMKTSSLGLMLTYDSRDNSYYPTSGGFAEMYWMSDRKAWGSDFEFNKLHAYYNYYHQLSGKDTLAMRAALVSADGNIPFHLQPSLNMRGFPNGLYKNDISLSAHIEWRRKFLPRWGFILFYEAGKVADSMHTLDQSKTITSAGGGLRWQVSADNKLNLGVDVGYSNGEHAVYVQVGEKF
jgi:hypothetical protein